MTDRNVTDEELVRALDERIARIVVDILRRGRFRSPRGFGRGPTYFDDELSTSPDAGTGSGGAGAGVGGWGGGSLGSGGTSGGGFDNPMEEAGDIIVGGEEGGADRLALGSDGTILGSSGGVLGYFSASTLGLEESLVYAEGDFVFDDDGEPVTLG